VFQLRVDGSFERPARLVNGAGLWIGRGAGMEHQLHLVEQVREVLAEELLATRRLTIEQVADWATRPPPAAPVGRVDSPHMTRGSTQTQRPSCEGS
jgi:hypothetical protein